MTCNLAALAIKYALQLPQKVPSSLQCDHNLCFCVVCKIPKFLQKESVILLVYASFLVFQNLSAEELRAAPHNNSVTSARPLDFNTNAHCVGVRDPKVRPQSQSNRLVSTSLDDHLAQ